MINHSKTQMLNASILMECITSKQRIGYVTTRPRNEVRNELLSLAKAIIKNLPHKPRRLARTAKGIVIGESEIIICPPKAKKRRP